MIQLFPPLKTHLRFVTKDVSIFFCSIFNYVDLDAE